jgi:beta-lactamase regulating signal transducer with metallopeptidase domain
MRDLIVYIIESSVLLIMFYLLYKCMLSRETFFHFNRFILLLIPMLALLFPLIDIEFRELSDTTVDQQLGQFSNLSKSYYDAMASWEFEIGDNPSASAASTSSGNWLNFAVLIYAIGIVICISRTVWSIRWIMKLLTSHNVLEMNGVKIVKISTPTAPFSFLNYVFVHTRFAESADFRQILEHERIHVQEKHTIDLLYIQIVVALFWFNPAIWQLLKSLKTTHEYIADRKIIQSGYSVSAYQTLLLRQLISNNSHELVHNFNFSFIKKRITMMTNKKSGWAGRTRVGLAMITMILAGAIIIQCNSKMDEQISAYDGSKQGAPNIEVPTLPASGYKFDGDLSNALTFTVHNSVLYIGDKPSSPEEIKHLQASDYPQSDPIVMMVDKEQPMGFIRKIHTALREEDRRKLLYIGQTATGDRVEIVLMLPPDAKKVVLPDVNKISKENLLKVDLGLKEDPTNQQKVYEFVSNHLHQGTAERCVVSGRINDDASYSSYLSNFFYIKEGYIKLYQERAHEMFGKDFYKTTREEYLAVRERLPTNISIAED